MSRLSRQTRTEFLAAWEDWDAKCLRVPKHPPATWATTETDRYIAAGKAAAAEFGPDVWDGDLHSALAEHRRDGLSYDHALSAVEGGHWGAGAGMSIASDDLGEVA